MTDTIVPSPYPEEEPVEPRRAHEGEEEEPESRPLDDDIDEETQSVAAAASLKSRSNRTLIYQNVIHRTCERDRPGADRPPA